MKANIKILLLGGTKQSKALAKELAGQSAINLITSLAGRTAHPETISGRTRSGGFGGWQGLKNYLLQNQIDLLIDATHPFATQISENAQKAADALSLRRIIFTRPSWPQQAADDWTIAGSIEEAVKLIPHQARCFLALGHQHIKPFLSRKDVSYVMRMISPPHLDEGKNEQPQNIEIMLSKPGKTAREEQDVFKQNKISLLVSRNSGGEGAYAKIEAARQLGMPVIMIERPAPIEGETYHDMRALMVALNLR